MLWYFSQQLEVDYPFVGIHRNTSIHKEEDKSRIRETLNLLTFADSSIDTKTDIGVQKGKKKKIDIFKYIFFM